MFHTTPLLLLKEKKIMRNNSLGLKNLFFFPFFLHNMSGSATPTNSNVLHNSLLRTRKSERDLETVEKSEIIEMGEEDWMPNLKENKRHWTPYSVMTKKKGFFNSNNLYY